jgi:hypothetical protein
MKQTISITEALQEIKTIDARVQKKKEFVFNYLYRQNNQRDPHEKDGGSATLIAQELQAIGDLLERKIAIRTPINEANAKNVIVVGGKTRSISDWLIWRRDVAPTWRAVLNETAARLQSMRQEVTRKGLNVTQTAPSEVTMDFVVNVNEAELAKKIEALEETLSTLDGQFSLKNATIQVEV